MPSRRIILYTITAFATILLLFFLPQTRQHQQLRESIHDVLFKPKLETTTPPEQSPGGEEETTYNTNKWYFQADLDDYVLPNFDDIAHHAGPRNDRGAGHETYATFFASRDSTLHDPYFIGTQQLIYRVLWDPRSKTNHHTMTVFVAPFVPEEQRRYFSAAGAIVKELPLRPFTPDKKGTPGRLMDMFSKLEMWKHTEYSKILYLDSDAFPMVNVDSIFEIAGEQTCLMDLLPPEDLVRADEICKYTLAGTQDFNGVNAGVLVFNPNEAMYQRLVRESLNTTRFDTGFMEQAMLNLAYDMNGPFPVNYIPKAYNTGAVVLKPDEVVYIVHAKLWATAFDDETSWSKHIFEENWAEMLQFYESAAFKTARSRDGVTTLS